MIEIITAGESHGDMLVGIVTGIPANLFIDEDFINEKLKKRQGGYGRSERMQIESDRIKILSGVRKGYSTGAPISVTIDNRGKNISTDEFVIPRPGHGDLVGALKYNQLGGRNILERSSARETAMRLALGSICELMLKEFEIKVLSHVINIGGIASDLNYYNGLKISDFENIGQSKLRVLDLEAETRMIDRIEKAKDIGDTLGGLVELIVENLPVGLGSHVKWDEKLDGKLAQAIMSLQGIKGLEFGLGFEDGNLLGSEVQDEIYYDGDKKRYRRYTNNLGGLEAGMTNGEDLVIKTVMKPIPTLMKPLRTVDMNTKNVEYAKVERSDVCAVPSASLVLEAIVSHVLANEMTIKYGGNSIEEMKENYLEYEKYLKGR